MKANLLAGMLVIPSIILGSILHGWALTILWRWFVVATFHAPALTLAQAMGIFLLVGLFRNNPPTQKNDDTAIDRVAKAIGGMLFSPLVSLGIGLIVKQFL